MTTIPAAMPVDLAAPWGGRSRTVDLGVPVHYADFGGPEDGVPLVLVHGLGGSHLNWVQIAPALAERRRVVALDLAGFGLTPGTARTTTVQANADLLSRFIDTVLGRPVVLVGNSMGGMISLLLAAKSPEQVAGLVLLDPSLPIPRQRPDPQVAFTFGLYAVPWVGERFVSRFEARYTDRERVLGMVALCFADRSRADTGVVDAGVQLTAYRRELADNEVQFLGAARSLLAVLRRPRRYDELINAVTAPVLLVHGEKDRLVPVSAARRTATLNPSWHTAFLEGVGHTPQLEVPERVLELLEPWLGATVG
jgi:pimeloyl-ACP methyl ester carboxylesterase